MVKRRRTTQRPLVEEMGKIRTWSSLPWLHYMCGMQRMCRAGLWSGVPVGNRRRGHRTPRTTMTAYTLMPYSHHDTALYR